jgi:FKBP-type peptidyl-prolyl cis-trans isomerase 2
MDGGAGILRPVTFLLGGSPLPGIVQGLSQGVQGMRVGGRRRLSVAPAQGFGAQAVLAPYAVVPPGSTLHYEVELLRLSRQGPDALMGGVAGCGLGGASQRTEGCATISPAEFL